MLARKSWDYGLQRSKQGYLGLREKEYTHQAVKHSVVDITVPITKRVPSTCRATLTNLQVDIPSMKRTP